jgi:hypothetical protein
VGSGPGELITEGLPRLASFRPVEKKSECPVRLGDLAQLIT